MSTHYVVTEIRIVEPVDAPLELDELEKFKEHVHEAITRMVHGGCTVEVECATAVKIDDKGSEFNG